MKKNKKPKKILAFIIAILLVIAIPVAGGGLIFSHYLNKIHFTDTSLLVDPTIDKVITMPSQLSNEDNKVKENIADNRLWYNDNIINILLVGCDKGSSDKYYPRSDSVIIASINKIDKVINLVSLSRATYVAIPGHGHARLNAAYSYGGPALLIKTIQQNYKIRIDNYISVDFEGFSKIIDALGGITIDLTSEEVKYLNYSFIANGIDDSKGAGTYTLNGDMALAYARTRKIDNDLARTKRQRNIIEQIVKKAKSASAPQAIKLMNTFLPLVSTDFTKAELTSQLTKAMNYVKWPMKQANIPHKGTTLVTIDGYEVLLFDWNVVKSDIHEQLYPGIEPKEPLK